MIAPLLPYLATNEPSTTVDTLTHAASSAGHAVADTLAHAAGHGGDHGGVPHLPNIIGLLKSAVGGVFKTAYHWEVIIFSFLLLIMLCIVAMRVYRRRSMIPGKLQNVVELLVEALYNFFRSILGDRAAKYTPFLGTLFIYILLMNWSGIIPFLMAPTSNLNITLSLALIVFIYAQYTGFKHLGARGWLYHMAGEPKDAVSWLLVPLLLIIHLIGEIAKPVSLSLRLFGNITGEDVLIAAFTGVGIMALSFMHSPVGLPLQVPFYFLGLLMSTIQALVFTSLATIYIALMLPHEEHAH